MRTFVLIYMLLATFPALAKGGNLCDETKVAFEEQWHAHLNLSENAFRSATGKPKAYYYFVLGLEKARLQQYMVAIRNSPFAYETLLDSIVAGQRASVDALLRSGIPVEMPKSAKPPAIVVAAQCRRTDLLDMLLSRGAEPSASDDQGLDAMSVSMIEDCETAVNLLLKHGYVADKNKKSGKKALALAKKLHGGKYEARVAPKK